jgi:hypothetical protein
MRCPICDNALEPQAQRCEMCGARISRSGRWKQETAAGGGHQGLAERLSGQLSAEVPVRVGRRRPTVDGQRTAAGAAARPDDDPAARRPTPFGGQAVIATELMPADPEKARETKIIDVGVPAMVRRAARERERPRDAEDDGTDEPIEELMAKLQRLYRRMHSLDRYSCWALCAALVAAFLPWRHVGGIGLVSGIEGYGLLSAAAALSALTLLYLRLHARGFIFILLLGQLLAAASIAAVPLYQVLLGVDGRVVWGVLVTAAASALAVLLTLARLTRINV